MLAADGAFGAVCTDCYQAEQCIEVAPSIEGPYSVLANGDNLLPNNNELEDPTIWWANNQYNVVLNDWKGKATGIGKAGVEYYSRDGLHYQLARAYQANGQAGLAKDMLEEYQKRQSSAAAASAIAQREVEITPP